MQQEVTSSDDSACRVDRFYLRSMLADFTIGNNRGMLSSLNRPSGRAVFFTSDVFSDKLDGCASFDPV